MLTRLPIYLRLTIVECLQYWAYINVRSVFTLGLIYSLNFTDEKAYNLYPSMITFGDVSTLIGGIFADRIIGQRFTWFYSYFFLILGFAIVPYVTGNEYLFVLGLMFISCGNGMARSGCMSMIHGYLKVEVAPEKRHSANSLSYSLLLAAAFFGYSFSGLIVKKFNFGAVFHFSCLLAIIACGWFAIMEWKNFKLDWSNKMLNNTTNWTKLGAISFGFMIFATVFAIFASSNSFLFDIHHPLLSATSLANALIFSTFGGGIYAIYRKSRTEDVQGRAHSRIFLIYLAWGVFYFLFERQFSMVVSVFLARNGDNRLFGFDVPVTNIMSFYPLVVLVLNLVAFKSGIHDKLTNRICLALGFSSVALAFSLLLLGFQFSDGLLVSAAFTIPAAMFFGMSDLLLVNRLFSLCRATPASVNATAMGTLAVGVATGFRLAKFVASYMAIPKGLEGDQIYTFSVYRSGFMLDLTLVSSILVLFILFGLSSRTKKLLSLNP